MGDAVFIAALILAFMMGWAACHAWFAAVYEKVRGTGFSAEQMAEIRSQLREQKALKKAMMKAMMKDPV